MFAKILFLFFTFLAAIHGKAMHLFCWAFDSSRVDVFDDFVSSTAVDCASNALGSSKDFFHGSRQLTGH